MTKQCECSCHYGADVACSTSLGYCCPGERKLVNGIMKKLYDGIGLCPECESERGKVPVPAKDKHTCAAEAKKAGVSWPWWI